MRTTIVKNELAVGLFVATAILIGVYAFFRRTREKGLLDVRRIQFVVPHGSGLQTGAPVLVRGIQVGSVDDIELTPDSEVKVTCSIAPRFVSRVRADAVASVVEPPLLGATTVELEPGTLPDPVKPNQALESTTKPALFAKVGEIEQKVDGVVAQVSSFVSTAQRTLETIESIALKVDRGEGLVGRLLHDEALARESSGLVSDARAIARDVREGEGALALALRDEAFADDIRAATSDLRRLIEEIDQGQGSLGRLLKDPALVEESTALIRDVRGSLAKLDALNEEARTSVGKVHAVLETTQRAVGKIEGLIDTADRVTGEVADTLHRINQGEGTIAALLNDDAIYRETKSLLKELRESVEDLREQAPINSFLGVVFSAF